jgi:hypothetical protein
MSAVFAVAAVFSLKNSREDADPEEVADRALKCRIFFSALASPDDILCHEGKFKRRFTKND